jgi:hypothetical protein
MDRNSILSGYKSSFLTYSGNDARPTVNKVLKYSGNNFDIRRRGDIIREVVIFKLLSSTTQYMIQDDKPEEVLQRFQANVFVEQSDSHSVRESNYDRILEIVDQLFDWANDTDGSSITSDVLTITVTGSDSIEEDDGYLSVNVGFESIIQI